MIFEYVDVRGKRATNISLRPPPSLQSYLESVNLFVSPPWIDFHSHVYHGVTSMGLKPDDIGWRTGVHLLVDAGSSGHETFPGFRDYIMPRYKTKLMAFLNISAIGLTTMREYYDLRNLNPEETAACVTNNPGIIAGIKVRSSGIILEDKYTEPLKLAVAAAEMANCPLLVHFGESPPSNAENLAFLRKGDTISHCFHGKVSPLWDIHGNPIPELEQALSNGVLLDVAHGAASLSADVASKAVKQDKYTFTISTDLHMRCINGPVYSLSHTMTKFLSMGLPLINTIASVTEIPAMRLNLPDWCSDIEKNATIFQIRKKTAADYPFVDSRNTPFSVEDVIEPVAVIMDGQWMII